MNQFTKLTGKLDTVIDKTASAGGNVVNNGFDKLSNGFDDLSQNVNQYTNHHYKIRLVLD